MNLKIVLLFTYIANTKAGNLMSKTSNSQTLPITSDGKAPILPPELWIIILKKLPKFPDIANAIIAKRRFRMLEDTPKVFLNFGLEDAESLQNMFNSRYREGMALKHTKSLLKLYRKFLKYPLYKAATYVLLWKLFSIINFDKTEYLDMINEVMSPFVKSHVDGRQNIKRYTQFKEDLVRYSNRLSLVHHINILKRLEQTYPHKTDGWRQFGYVLLLDSSIHLANKIPYETMLTVLDTYCSANGHYILYINSIESGSKNFKKSGELQVEKRFELNWNFYKGKVTNEFQIRSSVICASTAVRCLSRYYDFYHDDRKKFEYAQVVGAIMEILNHKPENFLDLVDNIQLNFVFFDLAIDDPFIRKCRKWLEAQCKNSRALRETGLKEQIIALNKINNNSFKLSDADVFGAVRKQEKIIISQIRSQKHTKQFKEEQKNIQKKQYMKQLETCETCDVEKMENFKDYIEILKVLRNVCTQNEDFLTLVWSAFLNFAEKPSLFYNLNELFEVDELHTNLFKLGESHVKFKKNKETRRQAKALLNIALPRFDHIFEIKPIEPKNAPRQRRILLKILLMLANRAYTGASIDQTAFDRMEQIHKLIYHLAKNDDLSDDSISQDPCFLRELFINDFLEIAELADKMNPSNGNFNFVFEPIEDTTKPSSRSPLLYQCILDTLECTDEGADYRPQLLKNLATIGANINHGEDFKRNIQEAFARSRARVYGVFFMEMEPYQNTDLKVFVESAIDFLLDKHLTVGISFDYDCYEGIRTAVTKSHKSGVDVKAKLGKELIGILDQMFHLYFHEYRKEFLAISLGAMYKNLHALLGFTLLENEELGETSDSIYEE